MAIQPIDLQTLFSRLHQISEDQAGLRDQAAQAQAVAGQESVKKAAQQASTVNLPEEMQEGPPTVDDKEGEGEPQSNRRRKKKPENAEETPGPEVFRDPDLGRNIDISG